MGYVGDRDLERVFGSVGWEDILPRGMKGSHEFEKRALLRLIRLDIFLVRHFDADMISREMYDGIRERIRRKGIRKRLTLRERHGREWYKVE